MADQHEMQIQTAGGETFAAYLALPPQTPAPGLLLLPPIFGVEPVIRELADAYAARGFVVAAVNEFWRDHEPQVMSRDEAGRAAALARAKRVDVELLVSDVRTGIEALRALPACNGKIAVLGFCFGGRYAYIAAARLAVDAAAAFHGTQIALSLQPTPRVPISLHFGEHDPVVPMSEVHAIEEALQGVPGAEVFVYAGAGHNFAIPGNEHYVPAVAEMSERRTFALFDRLKESRA